MIPLNFHHLYYFYTITQMGSVSKAAEKLRLGQPTLSSQLKQFENYLGRKLFERNGRKMILTEDGRLVLSYAAPIFDLGKELADTLKDKVGTRKMRIQMGVSDFTPKSYTDALCQFILKKNPDTYISIQEKDQDRMLEELDAHVLDLILTDAPHRTPPASGIESHLVSKVPVVFCGAPAMARKIKKLSDMNNVPMILPTSDSQVFHAVQDFFSEHKLSPPIVAEIQDVEVVRRLVLAGRGIAPINAYTVKTAPSHEKIKIIDIWMPRAIYDTVFILTKKRQRPHPLTGVLLKEFRLES